MKLNKLIKKINRENSPPDGWKPEDRGRDKPEEGKIYALTGVRDSKCILNGYSWKESEVKEKENEEKNKKQPQ